MTDLVLAMDHHTLVSLMATEFALVRPGLVDWFVP